IDAIYMAAVQALTGSGGWPMSVWLTPAREPFFGGTYFPPRDGARGARHGFLTVLAELVQTYEKDPERVKKASEALSRAAGGGMYDQIGGGFHRYSTDERWLVPHFEKMLYDNALLAVAYAEAHQVTGRGDFARVLRETLDYVLREMTAPGGGFYSATDADS